jgi:hypothetical protein
MTLVQILDWLNSFSMAQAIDWLYSLSPVQLVEWTGSLLALLGSGLLAANVNVSRYGWVLFLVSNAFLIHFAITMGLNGLLTMQIGFTLTSSLGFYRSFVRRPLASKHQLPSAG